MRLNCVYVSLRAAFRTSYRMPVFWLLEKIVVTDNLPKIKLVIFFFYEHYVT